MPLALVVLIFLSLFVNVGCKRITEIFSSQPSSSISEGTCLMNPSMPSVVLKIKGVGEQIVSFQSNVTGSLLQQYDKALLEDELRVGTTVVTSCEPIDSTITEE